VEIPFRIGDPVKVVEGPFNNFNGFVKGVNPEKLKVKVEVSILAARHRWNWIFHKWNSKSSHH